MNSVNQIVKMPFLSKISDAFRHALLADRERWILWAPLPMACGIVLYFSRVTEPAVWAGSAACILFLALTVMTRTAQPAARIIIISLFLAALGFAASQVRTTLALTPVLTKATHVLTLSGTVDSVDTLPKGYRVVMRDSTIEKGYPPRGSAMPERFRMKLKGNDPYIPHIGDVISLRGVLLPLSGPVAPDAYDFQRHAFFNAIGATGYAVSDVTPLQVMAADDDFFTRLRRALISRFNQGMGDRNAAAVAAAFFFNESLGIPEKEWDMIRRSGIAHLLAISGFHITVIAGFVFFLARALLAGIPYCALRWPIKKIAAGVSIFAAVFYLYLVGNPIPAARAVIMGAVVMFAIMIDRDPFSLRLAAFAAILVLLLKPESLLGPSFQMSFAAVVCLIAFYETVRMPLATAVHDKSWVQCGGLYLAACLLTTIVATFGTGAFALYHFSRVPLLAGLFSNMIAVPLSSVITLPAGAIACLLMPFHLEGPALWVVEKSLVVILSVAREAASWPHAVYQAGAWPAWMLAAMTFSLMWLCIWRGRWRYFGLAGAALVVAVIPFAPRADVLVSEDADLYAVRAPDQTLLLSSSRKNAFAREEWLEREGGSGMGYWDDLDPSLDSAPVRCDGIGCLYRSTKGPIVAFTQSGEALAQDCVVADIIVSERSLPDDACTQDAKTKIVIDKWDLRDNGAVAIYFSQDGKIDVKRATPEGYDRPWHPLRAAPWVLEARENKKSGESHKASATLNTASENQ